jgi:predicted transcriptional regulator
MGAGLKQPEVSIGMRTLHKNNWVAERDVKTDGKGRPMKVYKLSVPLDNIIDHYEDEKKNESTHTMEIIQKLRKMTTA